MLDHPFTFKLNDRGTGPNLLCQVFLERGWQEFSEESCPKDRWNIWWRTCCFPVSHYKSLKHWQFTNHIPKASAICRKDYLSRHLRLMKHNFGSIYDFSPEAFILPLDYTKLVEACSKLSVMNQKDDIWICKPVGQSQGKGISLFRKISELTYDTNTVVQKYVRNPLLIGGYKFDLRLYVCVPSFHPLTIYTYREGLARFSTDKFSLNDLKNKYAHLTNCSLNKQGPGYSEMKDKVGAGCKWNLKQLRYFLNQNGFDDWLLWQRIAVIIVLTISSQIPGVPFTSNCFEFYGFDILIDDDLKPWLLEVNLSPALGTDCDVDPAVKKPMLHDLFDLLGLPVCNTGLTLFSDPGLDQSLSSEEENDRNVNDIYSTVKKAASVVAIAQKWKNQINPSAAGARNKEASRSATPKEPGKSPRFRARKCKRSSIAAQLVGEYTGMALKQSSKFDFDAALPQNHQQSDETVASRPKWLWDNGLDWRQSPSEGGDWVRVYPFTAAAPKSYNYLNEQNWKTNIKNSLELVEKDLRTIVMESTRFSKMAKETHSKKKFVSDRERDGYLVTNGICDAVWHPTC